MRTETRFPFPQFDAIFAAVGFPGRVGGEVFMRGTLR